MIRRLAISLGLALALALAAVAMADGPADNVPSAVRRVPKPGIDVPVEVRKELEEGLTDLRGAIDRIPRQTKPNLNDLLIDIEICYKAVHDALKYNEFFAEQRSPRPARSSSWARNAPRRSRPERRRGRNQTGLVVRGYVSKIDGSVQPYGLVVPEAYPPRGRAGYRLDVWFHGRGETLSEVNFLDERRQRAGRVHPAGHDRPPPLRPVLQRQQVRRRGRRPRSDRGREARATGSTTTGSPSAASRWAARPAGSSPSITPIAGSPPTPGRGSPRRARFLNVFQKEDAHADLVRAEALAPLRLHRFRREPRSSARPSPTAARSTARSRRPT